jgi:hypothetical protein
LAPEALACHRLQQAAIQRQERLQVTLGRHHAHNGRVAASTGGGAERCQHRHREQGPVVYRVRPLVVAPTEDPTDDEASAAAAALGLSLHKVVHVTEALPVLFDGV